MSGRTLLQFFHWYTPGGGRLWAELAERAPDLARMGITDVWLPPVYKGASGGQSVGYDTYDLYDLGDGRREQRAQTIARCRDKVAALERQRIDIDAAVAELNDFVTLLQDADRRERAA